jgi:polyvinyl alcohol dehydrogenase (cytochrome)
MVPGLRSDIRTLALLLILSALLSPVDIDALSRFLGSNLVAPANAATACAETSPVPADAFADPHWNGWGGDAAQHRFQPAAMAELTAEDVPKLKLAWAFGFDEVNRAYAQPTIVGGRLQAPHR